MIVFNIGGGKFFMLVERERENIYINGFAYNAMI